MATRLDPDTVGPVDIALIVFEGNDFNGDVAPALAELQDNGTVHIIDLAFLTKDAQGDVGYVEVADAGISDAFDALAGDQVDLLSDEDLALMAADLEPSTSALVVVWENTWAARIGAAVRGSGGYLASMQRVPREIVETAIAALDEDENQANDNQGASRQASPWLRRRVRPLSSILWLAGRPGHWAGCRAG